MTHNKVTCPVCNGTKRRPVPDSMKQYKSVMASYDPVTDTLACNNCGAQYMFGSATGLVNVNSQGQPCMHRYISTSGGRCLTNYVCADCGDQYQIDSSD